MIEDSVPPSCRRRTGCSKGGVSTCLRGKAGRGAYVRILGMEFSMRPWTVRRSKRSIKLVLVASTRAADSPTSFLMIPREDVGVGLEVQRAFDSDIALASRDGRIAVVGEI